MKKAGKIVLTSIAAVLGLTLIPGNIVLNTYGGVIDGYFSDKSYDFQGETFTQAAAQSDALCQKIAEEGIALLRNERNTLPLADKKVNLFGWASIDNGFLLSGIGSGSSTIREDKRKTLYDAFKENGWETNADLKAFYEGYDNTKFKFGTGDSSRIRLIEPGKEYYTNEMLDDAEAFSENAVMVISRVCGENVGEVPTNQKRKEYGTDTDRSYLHISEQEEELLDILTQRFDNVIVLVNSSNTMELGFLEDYDVGAALNVSLLGQSGAMAIPKILNGEVNPSGRLADTFAYDTTTAPSFVNLTAGAGGAGYFEGIYFGYRYYETADEEGLFDNEKNAYGEGYKAIVQYPFGYGLSYSAFTWELTDVSLPDGSQLAIDSKVKLTFSCTNTSSVDGKDVLGVYNSAPYTPGDIEKSSVNLIDFVKTSVIPAGKTQTGIVAEFSAYDLASYDCYDMNDNGFAGYELDQGNYVISFRSDAHTPLTMAKNSLTYSVPSGGLKIEKDPVTGTKVENVLTGETAYAGIPLDGSTALTTAPTYLSRADFEGTWPKAPSGKIASVINAGGTYTNKSYDQTEMPVTGFDSGHRLHTDAGFNEELIAAIAEDYDGQTMDEIVDQLTVSELKKLVESSGFGVGAIESIGKPEGFDFDGPAGFNQNSVKADRDNGKWTAFPCEVLIGQTWDKNIGYQMGTAVAAEAAATGLTGWYAPGVNLHRTPYSGRNYEYYSEDPLLSGKMAANVVLGAKNHGLYCYIKHFTMAEEGPNPRDVDTWTTEQAFREMYLKPFEIAVKEGKGNAIMSGFNNIGATWCGSCYAQNVQILRNEWGFRGTMVTDWSNGDDNMYPERGIRAGNDIWLNPNAANARPLNMSNPTTVYCAKIAARNVIWTYCDTYNTYINYDSSNDAVKVEIGTVTVKKGASVIVPMTVGINVGIGVVALGLLALAWIPFKRKKPE